MISSLSCGKCSTPYDVQARQPYVNVCGHSFCYDCTLGGNASSSCPTCYSAIGGNGWIVNSALVDMLRLAEQNALEARKQSLLEKTNAVQEMERQMRVVEVEKEKVVDDLNKEVHNKEIEKKRANSLEERAKLAEDELNHLRERCDRELPNSTDHIACDGCNDMIRREKMQICRQCAYGKLGGIVGGDVEEHSDNISHGEEEEVENRNTSLIRSFGPPTAVMRKIRVRINAPGLYSNIDDNEFDMELSECSHFSAILNEAFYRFGRLLSDTNRPLIKSTGRLILCDENWTMLYAFDQPDLYTRFSQVTSHRHLSIINVLIDVRSEEMDFFNVPRFNVNRGEGENVLVTTVEVCTVDLTHGILLPSFMLAVSNDAQLVSIVKQIANVFGGGVRSLDYRLSPSRFHHRCNESCTSMVECLKMKEHNSNIPMIEVFLHTDPSFYSANSIERNTEKREEESPSDAPSNLSVCAHCVLNSHVDHDVIQYLPHTVREMLSSTVCEGKEAVVRKNSICDHSIRKGYQCMNRWKEEFDKFVSDVNIGDIGYKKSLEITSSLRSESESLCRASTNLIPSLDTWTQSVEESTNRLRQLHMSIEGGEESEEENVPEDCEERGFWMQYEDVHLELEHQTEVE